MASKRVLVAGGLVLAIGAAVLVERLIVTDKEAILLAADKSAQAISRGDVGEALKVLHPDALTQAGNPLQTRLMLEEALRQMPLDKVNFLVRDLSVENGAGKMSIDVMILPKDAKKAGSSIFRQPMVLTWEKVGDEWKVRKADPR
jgi:hypothetical protein